MGTSEALSNELQRIYVGGIQPPKLTIEIVQKRLESTLSDNVNFISFDKNKSDEDTQTFFFLTARSKDGKKQSALDIISKQYNNVKWKGSKIRVEKAKLHFLQRLEVEREEEKIRKQNEEEVRKAFIEAARKEEEEKSTTKEPPKKIKRALRIRKQFGEEAYAVDTKPLVTTTQKDLHFALRKQRENRQKHLQIWKENRKKRKNSESQSSSSYRGENEKKKNAKKNYSLQSKVFLNRAIHLYFDDDYSDQFTTAGNGVRKNIIYDNEVASANDKDKNHGSDDDASVDESSVPSSSSEDDSVQEDKREDFAWSDDDEPEEENLKSPVNDNRVSDVIVEEDGPTSESSFANNSELQQDHIAANTKDESNSNASDDNGYVWSESESDSDDNSVDGDKETQTFDYSKSKHDDLDEFAASFNDNSTSVLPWSWKTDDEECDWESKEKAISLTTDVKTNLMAVKKLYPELSGATPELFNEEGSKSQIAAPTGWDNSGLMQRYDPSADTATNYEVKSTKETIKEGGDQEDVAELTKRENEASEVDQVQPDPLSDASSEATSIDSSDEGQELDSNGTTTSNKSKVEQQGERNSPNESNTGDEIEAQKKQVYEQGKLESVFQQHRTDAGNTGFKVSSLFSFDIDGDKPKKSESSSQQPGNSSTGFSFSFQPDAKKEAVVTSPKEETATSPKENVIIAEKLKPTIASNNSAAERTEISTNPQVELKKLKKRRGLCFSTDELDKYEKLLFGLNGGIEGVLAAQKDPQIEEENQNRWHDERRVLTLDWKRKQRYAVSQRKKRIKFR
uniref:RRM domain-containing protein n=1 Tax=Chaetoceros debilis TaxID=122233 RepID=A0A7S3Q2F1_9STRA